MINLLDLQLNELEDLMKELGQPKFRATQVFGWLYKDAEKGAQVKIPAEKGATEKGAQVKIPVEKGATRFNLSCINMKNAIILMDNFCNRFNVLNSANF